MSRFVGLLFLISISYSWADDGYFWHVTDFHYDFSYLDTQLSCHGKDIGESPGRYGNYWCDSPWTLVNNSVHAMAAIMDDVDFVLWTGDTVLHGSQDRLSFDINGDILDNVTNLMKGVFPGKAIYATFGNHDYYPTDQFPPDNNALYNASLDRWRSWINDVTQDDEFLEGAYYTIKTQYGLRIVALNTNLYYTANKAVVNVTDPAGQFAWLRKVLGDAQTANEKVLLTAHIPPGIHTPDGIIWMYKQFNDELVDILTTYASVLTGMHFGHDHADGFKVLYDKSAPPREDDLFVVGGLSTLLITAAMSTGVLLLVGSPKSNRFGARGNPAVPIFIAPSVTPAIAHNPGIRLVKYDRESGRAQDIQQYYLDLPKANGNLEPVWELEYQTTTNYSLPDLSAASLDKLISRMKEADGPEFANYWKWYTVSTESSLVEACDAMCQAKVICGFNHFNLDDFQSCKLTMISASASVKMDAFVTIGLLTSLFFSLLLGVGTL